jgi:hypothetical protein
MQEKQITKIVMQYVVGAKLGLSRWVYLFSD